MQSLFRVGWTASVLGLLAGSVSAGPVPVSVERTDDGWVMLRDGEPYFVRGVGGANALDLLVEMGGNSFRTWSADDAERVLDEAHERGLTVTMGLWLQHPRHGFNYRDAEARQAQLERMIKRVDRYKDHPALLAWGVGNEVELQAGDQADLALEAVEEVAAAIKRIDPNHPTIAIIAGLGADKSSKVRELCPSIDILGVNKYGGAENTPAVLTQQGWDGPFMMTEFGPRGHWEIAATEWGAPIEPTSEEKYDMYARAYQGAVNSEKGKRSLGSYAFLWGNKQETTATWFGMLLETGETTPAADAISEAWTGKPPANSAPRISGVTGLEVGATVEPGEVMRVQVVARDPDRDQMRYAWHVIAETTDRRSGGDAERKPPEVQVRIRQTGRSARIEAPEEPGHYRLFVYAYDDNGGAGTINIPFRVSE